MKEKFVIVSDSNNAFGSQCICIPALGPNYWKYATAPGFTENTFLYLLSIVFLLFRSCMPINRVVRGKHTIDGKGLEVVFFSWRKSRLASTSLFFRPLTNNWANFRFAEKSGVLEKKRVRKSFKINARRKKSGSEKENSLGWRYLSETLFFIY